MPGEQTPFDVEGDKPSHVTIQIEIAIPSSWTDLPAPELAQRFRRPSLIDQIGNAAHRALRERQK